ncbi:MAG TPA: nickel-dependent lactate racemase [Acidimicrobiales bacterium]
MQVRIAYGTEGRLLNVPESASVILPNELPGLDDEAGAVSAAVRQGGLGALVDANSSVVVVFPDLTRPMPNRTVLPPLLALLEQFGVPDHHITLLCATGTHRQATRLEMEELVGADIVARYGIVDHQSDSEAHVTVGAVDGVPVRLQREYVEAEVRIITGFVEPHFFAGFSGGPKAVCPGLAATETILEAHHPRRIADARSTFVQRHGNPVHDFVRQAVALCPPHLSVDVTINRKRQITAVFAGELVATHDDACAFAEASAVQQVDAPFDVVVSTNGGYPLDRNLYQAVKGMAAAERIVRPGGIIIMAAACRDGVPGDGAFAQMLSSARSATDLLAVHVGPELDRWQAQVLGRVLQKAEVWLFSDGLSDDTTEDALLHPVHDLSRAVTDALARVGGSRVAVLPEGPLTVATVSPPFGSPTLVM